MWWECPCVLLRLEEAVQFPPGFWECSLSRSSLLGQSLSQKTRLGIRSTSYTDVPRRWFQLSSAFKSSQFSSRHMSKGVSRKFQALVKITPSFPSLPSWDSRYQGTETSHFWNALSYSCLSESMTSEMLAHTRLWVCSHLLHSTDNQNNLRRAMPGKAQRKHLSLLVSSDTVFVFQLHKIF